LDSENKVNNSKKAIAKEAEKLTKKIEKLKLKLEEETSSAKQVQKEKITKKEKKVPVKEDKKVTKKEKKVPVKEDKKVTKKEKKVPVKEDKKVTKKEKEEEAKKEKKEETKKEKKTFEEELEEQLTDDEIANFQIEKMDMEKLTNKVCEIVAAYHSDGIFQSELWKRLKLTSRDGSRLALKLERIGMISREKILEKGRWTYKLIIKKSPVSTQSIEEAPCLTCPVEQKCSLEGEISPRTCQLIEDWVLIEITKSKKKAK